MLSQEIAEKVAELSDLELALLLGLLAPGHCLIQTEENALDSLQQELQLVRLDLVPSLLPLSFCIDCNKCIRPHS